MRFRISGLSFRVSGEPIKDILPFGAVHEPGFMIAVITSSPNIGFSDFALRLPSV